MAKSPKNQLGPFREWFGGKTLPPFARAILEKRGGELFVVGGAVRDALLGRVGNRDLDLVVRGIPIGALLKLLRQYGKVDEVGRVFGVIKFLPKGEWARPPIDIALPRTEFSFGTGGYKDVETTSRHTLPLAEDLKRRDFTVNAMAWDLGAGNLVDPLHGERDLSKRELRAVGDPSTRFREDYTRILRLLRFAVELDFAVAPTTWRAAKTLAPHLKDKRKAQWVVPRELVAKELLKALAAEPLETFLLWDRVGIWKILVPEIEAMKGVPQPPAYHTEGDVWEHTRLALAALTSPAFAKKFPGGYDAETALAVLFHDIGKPPMLRTPERHGTDRIRFDGHDKRGGSMGRAIAERLALSSFKGPRIDVDPGRLEWVVAHHLLMVSGTIEDFRPQTIERYFLSPRNPGELLLKVMYCDVAATINANGKPSWESLRALERRIAAVAKMRKRTGEMPKPLLDGNEIMRAAKLSAGPEIGVLLASLRDAQLSGRVKTKVAARAFIVAESKRLTQRKKKKTS